MPCGLTCKTVTLRPVDKARSVPSDDRELYDSFSGLSRVCRGLMSLATDRACNASRHLGIGTDAKHAHSASPEGREGALLIRVSSPTKAHGDEFRRGFSGELERLLAEGEGAIAYCRLTGGAPYRAEVLWSSLITSSADMRPSCTAFHFS